MGLMALLPVSLGLGGGANAAVKESAFQSWKSNGLIPPLVFGAILQMSKLKPREGKQLPCCPTACVGARMGTQVS